MHKHPQAVAQLVRNMGVWLQACDFESPAKRTSNQRFANLPLLIIQSNLNHRKWHFGCWFIELASLWMIPSWIPLIIWSYKQPAILQLKHKHAESLHFSKTDIHIQLPVFPRKCTYFQKSTKNKLLSSNKIEINGSDAVTWIGISQNQQMFILLQYLIWGKVMESPNKIVWDTVKFEKLVKCKILQSLVVEGYDCFNSPCKTTDFNFWEPLCFLRSQNSLKDETDCKTVQKGHRSSSRGSCSLTKNMLQHSRFSVIVLPIRFWFVERVNV